MVRSLQPSPINVARQAINVRRHCEDFVFRTKGDRLVGTGWIQPGILTERYHFRLYYRMGQLPKIRILQPKLHKREGSYVPIPHIYGPNEPCVFFPEHDWRPWEYIGQTVVPWLAEWLYFYELWHATGEWLGGGLHPDRTKKGKVINVPT